MPQNIIIPWRLTLTRGFLTTALIREDEDGELSVLMCKAITRGYHPYLGYPTPTDLLHSDDEEGFLEVDLYQGVLDNAAGSDEDSVEANPSQWGFSDFPHPRFDKLSVLT